MQTRILSAENPQAVEAALQVLNAGGLVAFPTDTVYGLAASLHDPQAIERLYTVKGRETSKAIPVLLGRPEDLALVAGEMGPAARRLAERFWPGPLTLVVPERPGLPENLSARPTIGVRMPDHPVALALLCLAGPLAVTSANLSGAANTTTAWQVYEQLNERIELILDGGETPGGAPSTVVDCTGPEPVILRPGPISAADLQRTLENGK